MHRIVLLGIAALSFALPLTARAQAIIVVPEPLPAPPASSLGAAPPVVPVLGVPEPPIDDPGRGRRRASTILLVAGIPLFVGGYFMNALLGYGAGYECTGGGSWGFGLGTCGHNEAWSSFRDWSLVPVLGPFVQLGLLPDSAGSSWVPTLIASGIMQTIGFAALVTSVVLRLMPDDGAETGDAAPAFVVAPAVSPTDAGLIVEGRF